MISWKRFLLCAALGLSSSAQLVRAQDTAPPAAATPAPDASADSNPPASASGNLFPEAGPQTPAVHRVSPHLGGNKGKHGARARDIIAEEADSDPLDVRVAYRRAKTIAMVQDPGLAEFLRRSASASTDREKRNWLRLYYTGLFGEIKKIDPSPTLAAHVALLSEVAEQRYDPQRRVVAGEEDLVNGRHGHRR